MLLCCAMILVDPRFTLILFSHPFPPARVSLPRFFSDLTDLVVLDGAAAGDSTCSAYYPGSNQCCAREATERLAGLDIF